MNRGEIYLVQRGPGADPKRQRAYVIVGREEILRARFSTVICAPVYSKRYGLITQVTIGVAEGMKHESSIHCDELMSIEKSRLTRYVGRLSGAKLTELNHALRAALALDDPFAESGPWLN